MENSRKGQNLRSVALFLAVLKLPHFCFLAFPAQKQPQITRFIAIAHTPV